MRGGWSRADAITMASAAVLAWTTRAALRGRGLYSWDSGLLAAGIVEFDFLHAQPHPPFYPLTIAMGKLLAPWTGPDMALVWLSVGASGVMVAGTYAVARHFMALPGAALAALLAFAAPVAVFNGSVSLSYSLEGAATVSVAWAALWVRRRPGTVPVVTLAILVSAAVGIRQSSLFFLGPLSLWAVWGRWRDAAVAVAAGTVATLGWLVPTIVAGGGWNAFVAVNAYQSEVFILHDPAWVAGWPAVLDKARRLASYVPHEMPFLVAVAILGAVTSTTWRPRGGTVFWLAWALPPLAFFLFVYAGWPIYPTGYVMVLVPPGAVGAAAALDHAWRQIHAADVPLRKGAAIAVAAVAIMPVFWFADWDDALRPMRETEAWESSWAGLEAVCPSHSCALLTFYAWNWAKLHHGDHLTWAVQPSLTAGAPIIQVEQTRHGRDAHGFYANLFDGTDDPLHVIPSHIERIVIFDDHPIPGPTQLVKAGLVLHNASLPSGRVVQYFEPAGLPNIEAAFPWTDADGRIVVAAPAAAGAPAGEPEGR